MDAVLLIVCNVSWNMPPLCLLLESSNASRLASITACVPASQDQVFTTFNPTPSRIVSQYFCVLSLPSSRLSYLPRLLSRLFKSNHLCNKQFRVLRHDRHNLCKNLDNKIIGPIVKTAADTKHPIHIGPSARPPHDKCLKNWWDRGLIQQLGDD